MAPAIAPPYVVDGAERTPLPFGLFSTIPAFRTGTADRWKAGGVTWEPDDTHLLEVVGPLQWEEGDQDGTSGLPKDLDYTIPTPGTAARFTVLGKFQASPQAWDQDLAYEKARINLLNNEERTVEHILWNGDRGVTPNFTTLPLIPGSFSSPIDALDDLEQWMGDEYGSLGVIHLCRSYASVLMSERLLQSQGGRLFTRLGTPVAVGAGYALGRMVVTPALFGYRDEPFDASQSQGDLLDRNYDNQYAISEREYLIGYDPVGGGYAVISE